MARACHYLMKRELPSRARRMNHSPISNLSPHFTSSVCQPRIIRLPLRSLDPPQRAVFRIGQVHEFLATDGTPFEPLQPFAKHASIRQRWLTEVALPDNLECSIQARIRQPQLAVFAFPTLRVRAQQHVRELRATV